jgi:hypothetical protein
MWVRGRRSGCLACAMLALAAPLCQAGTPHKAVCARVAIVGQVSAGGEWSAKLGDGWVFRVLPIAPSHAGYSGWDLVMDRDPPAGFPDSLLLATLPYNSINEREIGTTFGLRAQDAIGWNPRSFHFLSNPRDVGEGQRLFRSLMEHGLVQAANGKKIDPESPTAQDMARLLELQKGAATGEFRILEARIVPGVADPAPFAQGWALASSRTPHQIEPAAGGRSSARGMLHWMRFAVTLWLPANWGTPEDLHPQRSACPE